MTYSHEETQARLLDLVYGEAAPAERASLEAHVAGCARCQAELAALSGTRARVRAALVEQPAPKGVHARLLQAATEAVAPASAARAVAAAAPAARARAAAPTETPSLWQKLRRGWTLPTFATVGAFAILLLASKVFLSSPQRTYERGREGIIPAAPPPAEHAPPRDVERQTEGAAAADKAPAFAGRADEPAAKAEGPRGELKAEERHALGAARERDVAKALGNSMRHEHGADGLSGLLDQAPAANAFGSGASRGVGGGSVGGSSANLGGRRSGVATPKAEERLGEEPLDTGGFARPPGGWKGGAPAAAPASPASAPTRAPAKRVVADDFEAAEAPASAKADRSAEQDEVEARPARAKLEKAEPAPAEKKKAAPPPAAVQPQAAPAAPRAAAAAAPVASVPVKDSPAREPRDSRDSNDAKAREASSTQEALARRAEQLFAAQRWDEAIAAYRELLRRFPAADPAAKWRARVAQAQRESVDAVATRKAAAAKAAKATTAAPAEGQ